MHYCYYMYKFNEYTCIFKTAKKVYKNQNPFGRCL